MHRTYSMRHSRAPTASQVENPPPPLSTTKTSRIFGGGSLAASTSAWSSHALGAKLESVPPAVLSQYYPESTKDFLADNAGSLWSHCHAFRKSAAGAFGPDLAKKLSQLVKMEKNVMRSMELVGRERMEVAQQLSIWGEGCDEDVSDVTDKLGVLIYEVGELEDQLVDRYDQYRVTIKSIRNIEASVQPSRDILEQELVRAEAESLVAEAQLSNITREKVKSAFSYQFDSLREHCEKLAIIAGYGKHLLELIDDTPVTPGETRPAYDGYEASKAIIQDCEEALTNWVSSNAAVNSKLSARSRTLSQRRRSNMGRSRDGVDLAGQDLPMRGDRDSWVQAQEHSGYSQSHAEEEYDGDEVVASGEIDSRTEERLAE
ncbi:sphingolipid long chain base-responsive protein LSP1 [Uncinocarpus reesii 1704]|uniref:Sphingolipid long chain base-responsive protein LSP1 n=1 Tax=Uncinocarpus reesii (strain UAMH 1704) TaxID=336963 RepID=C4JFA4_UNCRE|nr:sphingolipid long chain base-responsive protein LSP1 [Uncinocarpus reesii 1704]EEP77477.1 sphingolipid long chain base-responsive protein LSP1 [Uncinocarpus reesii 1704]